MSEPDPKPHTQFQGIYDDDQEDNQPIVPRRHKAAIRRASSFKKYTSISGSVNDWFFSSGLLKDKFATFATKNLMRSAAFTIDTKKGGTTGGGGGVGDELDLKATEVHEEFCGIFEEELEKFLGAKGVTMDEFQETFKLELEEEKRSGKHFYRWMEVIEFETFLVMMRATATMSCSGDAQPGNFGVEKLQEHIQGLSSEAKQAFRKQSTLRPLLVRWCPAKFDDILTVLQATSKTSPHGLDRTTSKAMASWKGKLSAKIKDNNGVYTDPLPDEDAWTRYLEMYTSKMSDDGFSNFVRQVEAHVAGLAESETPEAKIRRCMWRCFAACDPLHEGTVDLHYLDRVLEKPTDMWPSEKEKKKSFAKWTAALIPGQSKDVRIPMAMGDFSKFLTDIFGGSSSITTTVSGEKKEIDATTSLIIRVDKLTDRVEDSGVAV